MYFLNQITIQKKKKMKVFESFAAWREYFLAAARTLLRGLCTVLWSLALGIVSIMVYAYRSVVAFCRRERTAAIIIAIIGILVCAGWLGTFVRERSERVAAEYQRDSLSYIVDSVYNPHTGNNN